jgi:hypothetical protein
VEEPSERELTGRDAEVVRELAERREPIDVAFEVLRLEPGSVVTEVAFGERSDRLGEEAVSERSSGDDPDAELARGRH